MYSSAVVDLLAIVLLLAETGSAGLPVERTVRIEVPNHDAVYHLNRQVEIGIITAEDNYIIAVADDIAINRLRSLGYRVTVLIEDNARKAAQDLVEYYSYTQVCSIMHSLALAYPGIARLETLGFSVGARPIPAMKVTENPWQDANRPRVRLIGAHHGDEKISTEVALAFLLYLCLNYGSDSIVTRLVNTREFWLVPILNVDGHVANRRTNNNGRDLNRDYGYEWENYSEPFSQPETRAVLSHSFRHVPTLEYEYHSTASYVNYLWDNHPADPPDSGWIITLSRRYADSTYGSSLTRLQPINGYDWYEVHGSCQDFTFGGCGGLAWTIETQQPSTRPKIDSICLANRRALLDMADLAGRGINGRVYDSVTGVPLYARVELTSPPRWPAHTNVGAGDFHKMVAPGTYAVRVCANGYVPKTFFGLVVPDTGLWLDVPLARPVSEPWLSVQRVLAVKRIDDTHIYKDWVYNSLGEPDGVYYNIGPSTSNVIFGTDQFEPAQNRVGNDITVHATGSYSIAAAEDWKGPWYVLGNASGVASFDLASVNLDSARYLKLTNTGSAALDAITYLGRTRTDISESGPGLYLPRLVLNPNPASARVNIKLEAPIQGRSLIYVTDIAGRTVRLLRSDFSRNQACLTWPLDDESGRLVPDGVYFCRLGTGPSPVLHKLIIARH
ncbi:MAG: M14 family zinc carboxypeptidase [candidate division WOR-3 bacterium]